MINAYATKSAKSQLEPFQLERRSLRPHDVQIDILFCGVCHTDIHTARNEWKNTMYPCVPGHEIVGKVVKIGTDVTNFKIGDRVAVGCMVDSCNHCSNCKVGEEQYCDTETIYTYNSKDRHDQTVTFGGYSTQIVVDEKFVLHVPEKFKDNELPNVAPLLCAGITTYSPLKHWQIKKGSKVGIVGLGGLGHMGVKLAHTMGATVVLFTTSQGKVQDAKKFGANEVVISNEEEQMKKHVNSLDLIINTVAVPHNLDNYVVLLKKNGVMCLVGAPEHPHPSPNIVNLILKRRSIAGSVIGGIKETQEMLNFCADHDITSDVEIISIQKINEAYDRMLKNDVKYRFVIDLKSLK